MNRILHSADLAPLNVSRVSWGAVFVGLLLATVTYIFLAMLGTAIGAGALDPLNDRNPFAGFGTGAGIWVGATTLVSLAVGAFFAGRTAPTKGILHGILSWAITTLVTLYLLSSLASSTIGVVSGIASKGISLGGQGVVAAAPAITSGINGQLQKSGIQLDLTDVQSNLETLLRQTGKPELDPATLKPTAKSSTSDSKNTAAGATATPQDSSTDLDAFFDRLKQKAQPALEAADKDALINIIQARTGKSHAEAEKIAENYARSYDQVVAKYQSVKTEAEQKARAAGDAAVAGVSRAAWAGVIILLLGIIVSGGFGYLGRRSDPMREEIKV